MADVKLSVPRVRVVLGDDSVHEVQCINADMVRFDLTRATQKWPGPETAPMLWLTFLTWAALRRTHTIAESVKWEDFRDTTQEVVNLTDDDEQGADVVDPSQQAVEPG